MSIDLDREIAGVLSEARRASEVQPVYLSSGTEEDGPEVRYPVAVIAAVPEGMQQVDLTDRLDKLATKLQPWRRTGIARLSDLDSLIAWANRHKGDSSALFADTGAAPKITCIADYLGAGAPVIDAISRDPKASHMQHRAQYAFPLSKEWKAWTAIDGQALSGPELGEFVEANAKDLLAPSPAILANNLTDKEMEGWERRMIETAQQLQGRFGQYATLTSLARNFVVNEVSNIQASMDRDSGESSIQFLNEHRDADGAPIKVPNLFLLQIPVFEEGPAYRIAVRFRYRKAGQAVKFFFTLHNPEEAFRDTVNEALAKAQADTGLPLFRGTPEVAN